MNDIELIAQNNLEKNCVFFLFFTETSAIHSRKEIPEFENFPYP